jgi:endonuclease YncB( thermonuclease family)
MRIRSRRLASAAVAALAVSLASATYADSSSAAAPTVHYWYGKVVRVVDGDTVVVDIAGDGTSRGVAVRNAGIQATETTPTVECHAAEAKARMAALLPPGTRVRLAAEHPGSESLGRPLRYVDAYQASTKRYSLDVQAVLLREGLVLWLPWPEEPARNNAYRALQAGAVSAGKNLYDPGYTGGACAYGPQQSAKLVMWLRYDADGDDAENLNGEYVRIRNDSGFAVNLSGWRLRNHSHHFKGEATYWAFPKGAQIKPGEYITVHSGEGRTGPRDLYLGDTAPRYGNIAASRTPDASLGNDVYLLDPDGDLRAWAVYPCVPGRSCRGPAGLAVTDVDYTAKPGLESITVTNTGSGRADLTGLFLEENGRTYEIQPGTVLGRGEDLVVRTGDGRQTRTRQYWGNGSTYMLANSGGTARLRTWDGYLLASKTW